MYCLHGSGSQKTILNWRFGWEANSIIVVYTYNIYIYIYIYAYLFIYIYMCVYVCMFVSDIYIYTYIHTWTLLESLYSKPRLPFAGARELEALALNLPSSGTT